MTNVLLALILFVLIFGSGTLLGLAEWTGWGVLILFTITLIAGGTLLCWKGLLFFVSGLRNGIVDLRATGRRHPRFLLRALVFPLPIGRYLLSSVMAGSGAVDRVLSGTFAVVLFGITVSAWTTIWVSVAFWLVTLIVK